MNDTIEVFDQQGNAIKIPRAEYARQLMQVAQQHWDSLDTLRQLILQLMQQGFAAEALKLAHRACELSNENVNDLYWRAASTAETGQLDDAARMFAELQDDAAFPGDQARAATGLAKVKMRQGNMDEAADLLDWAVETDTMNPGPLLAMYGFWTERQKPDVGLMKINEAVARNASAAAYRALAQLAAASGDNEALVKHAGDAVARAGSPDEREETIAEVTWLFGQAGLCEEVIDMVEPQVKEIHHPHTLMNLAQAFEDVGRKDDARSLLTALREGAPEQMQQFIDMKMQQMDNEEQQDRPMH